MDKNMDIGQLFSFETITDTITDVLNGFELKEAITKVGLFGSVARGTWHKDSDIDLIVDYDFSGNTERKVQAYCKLGDMLSDSFPVDVSIVDLESLNYEENSLMRSEVLKDVVWIYG